jgi:hypothetical protein
MGGEVGDALVAQPHDDPMSLRGALRRGNIAVCRPCPHGRHGTGSRRCRRGVSRCETGWSSPGPGR